MKTVFRLAGALLRAGLVVMLVATPAILLPVDPETRQIVALMALFAGVLVLVEYAATYPGLIEFRHAPPFNRIRFLSLFLCVVALSALARGQIHPTAATFQVTEVGAMIGERLDFPLSPVRLVLLSVADVANAAQLATLRAAAGLSAVISLMMLGVFVLFMRFGQWPVRGQPFNLWINLPTFEPSAGSDIVYWLERDARINISLGSLLPFLLPAAVQAVAQTIAPPTLANPQVLIWTMALWSFLPASLLMRGMAMSRVAGMIRAQRQQDQVADAGLAPA